MSKKAKKGLFFLFYVIIFVMGCINVKKKLLVYSGIVMAIILFFVLAFYNIKVEKVEPEQPEMPIKKISNDDILRQVLNGEKEFINADGNEILLNDLKINDASVKINKYTFVDLDNDNNKEVIAVTDSYYDYSLILHIDNNIIYGYNVKNNELKYINTLGIIYEKEDNTIMYKRIMFNKNNYNFKEIASYRNDKYMIDNEEVSQEKFNTYQDNYIKEKFLSYKSFNNKWMEQKLMNQYSFTKYKIFDISLDNSNLIFMNNQEFENFNSDLINEKFILYYMDSNDNSGRVYIRKYGEEILKDNNDLYENKSVGVYDEESQYMVLVTNNDKMDSDIDNNFEVYYFKYYNKDIQYLGSYNTMDLQSIFNDEAINELNNFSE